MGTNHATTLVQASFSLPGLGASLLHPGLGLQVGASLLSRLLSRLPGLDWPVGPRAVLGVESAGPGPGARRLLGLDWPMAESRDAGPEPGARCPLDDGPYVGL